MEQGYSVVLLSTEKAGGSAGAYTWTTYPSKEAFDAARQELPGLTQGTQEVVAEGVTAALAQEYVGKSSLESYLGAALEESRTHDGAFDAELLMHELEKSLYLYERLQRHSPSTAFDGVESAAQDLIGILQRETVTTNYANDDGTPDIMGLRELLADSYRSYSVLGLSMSELRAELDDMLDLDTF